MDRSHEIAAPDEEELRTLCCILEAAIVAVWALAIALLINVFI